MAAKCPQAWKLGFNLCYRSYAGTREYMNKWLDEGDWMNLRRRSQTSHTHALDLDCTIISAAGCQTKFRGMESERSNGVQTTVCRSKFPTTRNWANLKDTNFLKVHLAFNSLVPSMSPAKVSSSSSTSPSSSLTSSSPSFSMSISNSRDPRMFLSETPLQTWPLRKLHELVEAFPSIISAVWRLSDWWSLSLSTWLLFEEDARVEPAMTTVTEGPTLENGKLWSCG